MPGLVKLLRSDEELIQMRKEWEEKIKDEPFWPYNYDEFNGVIDYKKQIRKRLDEEKEK